MVTPTTFKIRFTEFDSIEDNKIQMFIDDSYLTVGSNWGVVQDLGVFYLTAHYIALALKTDVGNGGTVAQVSSKSVEGISLSYAVPQSKNASEAYFSSTIYGQKFLSHKKTITPRAFLV